MQVPTIASLHKFVLSRARSPGGILARSLYELPMGQLRSLSVSDERICRQSFEIQTAFPDDLTEPTIVPHVEKSKR